MASVDFPVQFAGEKYDLKKFLKDHPGGVNTLEKYKGKSIVQAMKMYGHSYSAYHILSDFKIESGSEANLTGGISENGRIITKAEADRDAEEIAFLEELEVKSNLYKIFYKRNTLQIAYYNLFH